MARGTPSLPLVGVAALLSLLAAGAHAQCTYGDYDLSTIPEAQLQIDQEYNNQPATPYTWVVNLCQPVSHPPDQVPECVAKNGGAPFPGYITEYSSSHCQTSWGKLTGAVAGDNAVVMSFGETADSNNPGWTATMALVCGPTLALTPTNNVIVTGNDLTKLAFSFAFSTSAVCTPVPTPSPTTPIPGPPPPTLQPPGPVPVCGSPAGTPTPHTLMHLGRSPNPNSLPPVLSKFFQGIFTAFLSLFPAGAHAQCTDGD